MFFIFNVLLWKTRKVDNHKSASCLYMYNIFMNTLIITAEKVGSEKWKRIKYS